MPSCDSPYTAATAGAVSSLIGVDRLFNGLGAPTSLHWALMGYGAESYLAGRAVSDPEKAAMSAAMGYVGGLSIQLLRRAGVPMLGPFLQF